MVRERGDGFNATVFRDHCIKRNGAGNYNNDTRDSETLRITSVR